MTLEVGWEFRDEALVAAVYSGDGIEFQRLEFLGDAIADAVLVRWIYRWSTGTVAVLAGARQQLTSDRTLGRLAALTGLHDVLTPELKAVPERSGDLIEAIVGAAFLDGGWPAATAVCETVFGRWLSEPDGVGERAARIDTAIQPDGERWRWQYEIWMLGSSIPISGHGNADDAIDGEVEALCSGLERISRDTASVWVEVSDDLRAAMADATITQRTPAIQTLRALLTPFNGVWFVPSQRIDTTLAPWGTDHEPDGRISGFELLIGHDLRVEALERLALCPGPEQRRLAFVGDTVLKSAAAISAFTNAPASHEGGLTDQRLQMIALDRLHRAALDIGLTSLLIPGQRPADPTKVIKATLGALAVDAGVEHAVDIARRWIRDVRIKGALPDALTFVRCCYDTTSHDVVVHIDLTTPRHVANWQFHDQTVSPIVRGIEGICAAIDTLTPDEMTRALLIDAPPRIADAVGRTEAPQSDTQQAVQRLLHRLDQHGLKTAWAYR
jgi:dsRNA-specific ribonuclease